MAAEIFLLLSVDTIPVTAMMKMNAMMIIPMMRNVVFSWNFFFS